MGKMKALLLDNSMFDDGSIECKNFQVVVDGYEECGGLYNCEWDYIKNHFRPEVHSLIIFNIAKGIRHCVFATNPDNCICMTDEDAKGCMGWCGGTTQISWD